jgi:hypothetical protein
MNRIWLAVLVLCGADAALAEESGLSVSLGARAWYTEWTTFSYFVDEHTGENVALTQVSADDELAIIPLVSARYRNFMGSITAIPSTEFSFSDGSTGKREEFDATVGYFVMPGVALTLGYKKVQQSGNAGRYRPSGPMIGIAANAPLRGAWSVYGNLGLGRLKTPSGDKIDFEMKYRITELGLAYSLNGERLPRQWTLTAGYRMQVMNSIDGFVTEAGVTQDGLDTTQGFTLGLLATF